MNRYLIIPLSNLITKPIINWINSFREPVETVEINEKELWKLLKKYQKEANVEGEDFVKLGAFVKYVFIKLRLRR